MSMTVQPQPDRPDPTLIAVQNDAFRKLACFGVPPAQPIQGRMHVTRSLMEAGDGFMAEAVKATGEFATFEPENDPEGWHDFGAVEIRGETVFWKIDLHEEITFSSPFLSVQRWFGSSIMLTPVASTCIRWACCPNQISVHVPGMEPPWLGPNFYRVCEDHQSSRSLNHPALRVILKFQYPVLHLRLQNRARRDKSRFHISPQGHDELAGKSHNGDFLSHSRVFSRVFSEPARECALRLIPQPAPRQFDPEGARRSVSSFADTLASFDITTGIRAGRQAKVRRQVSPVLELSPEHLCGQEHRTVSSNTAKPFEQHGLLVFRKPLRFSRKGFVAFLRQSLDHLVRQFQAFERAHDLAHELIGERAAIGSFEAIQFLAPCDHRWIDMPDALQREEGTNAIDVASALAHQPLALSVKAFGVFFSNGRDAHSSECLSITGTVVLQQNDHAFGVDAIRFDPAGSAVHEKAGRIQNQGFDPFAGQQPLQPETIVSSFEADDRSLMRPAKLTRLRNGRSNQINQSCRIKPVQTHGFDLGQLRRIKRHKPFRFAQINGDKAGRRNRWCHHLGNLPFCESAPNLSGSRNLLHGNFYEAGSDFRYGAETPDNPATTMRVLTIMLACDW
jgi:hypothetical protein